MTPEEKQYVLKIFNSFIRPDTKGHGFRLGVVLEAKDQKRMAKMVMQDQDVQIAMGLLMESAAFWNRRTREELRNAIDLLCEQLDRTIPIAFQSL